jgi:hypothetical protein
MRLLYGFLLYGINIANSQGYTTKLAPAIPSLYLDQQGKVEEGKSKLSVLNAVKNKLLARIIAVVNKQELYVKKVA